jgi:hypothetical protein
MVPAPIDPSIKDVAEPIKDTLKLPSAAKERLEKSGVDLSKGYPYRPSRPLYLDDVYKIRDQPRDHIDAGARADKSKKNLLSAATKLTDLTAYIGTEIEGLQLKDLTNQQRDELALLIAERSVVFLRDQDLSPQQQKELGEWYGEVEVHVSYAHKQSDRPRLTMHCSPKSLKSQVYLVSASCGPISRPLNAQPASANLAEHRDGTLTLCMRNSQQESPIFTTTLSLQSEVIRCGHRVTPRMRSYPQNFARLSMGDQLCTALRILTSIAIILKQVPSGLRGFTL